MRKLVGIGTEREAMRISIHGREYLYLDAAATLPMGQAVAEAVAASSRRWPGNPSSIHDLGRQAAMALGEARERFLELLGLAGEQWRVVFTSGGTEADALAVLGTMAGRRGRVVVSAVEHPAVLGCVSILGRWGVEVEQVPCGADGIVAPGRVAEVVGQDVRLVSVLAVQNEIGVLQDVPAIARAVRAQGASVLVHTDAVQALGHMDLGPVAEAVDLMSLSAHKIGGPRGCGALLVRRGVHLDPIIGGGGQQEGLRPGTEDLPSIHGFLRALEEAARWPRDRFHRVGAVLREELDRHVPELRFLGAADRLAGHILAVAVPGIGSEVLVRALSQRGVCVSAGSACRTRAGRRSPVFGALGVPSSWGVVRFSWGPETSEEDVREAARLLGEVVAAYAI